MKKTILASAALMVGTLLPHCAMASARDVADPLVLPSQMIAPTVPRAGCV